ncbi:UvrD/REP helicase [Pseudomonas savastanoi pv. glycinea]|uniref:DNA 3'-5' helicase II n=2 Tax=Pseudomonas savastanoi pv. glycinea TaxID=318 RepID=A0A3M3IX81_PSESG|nr:MULTISPECIES: UvrD-helicase domain-containing protein [Pseudomonas syringae group]EFW84426.1 UvrD/REP helicase [Pseudomonas savastanoi pv. glycinea str. race 4]EGH19871.1 UvrD/REP helicase [Pseudomonas savastanoi pv. glycinea str. race 4]MCQ3008223.1 UvrD-helicase domain-containing protein [Pseudomonas savastanoi]MDY2562309.1 UvrD-helicase domain-containing protein [Pseudomonas syringae]RMN02986.1 UvrD/REP helicase [Pseudomonas savastanoi pv. glycinea]
MTLSQLVAPVTDADVDWVIELMGLDTLDEPRRDFLKSMDTVDVAACPGSGKTTLVVAKLAILARHWKSRMQGICVLSHTNAAREEIEKRLGGTEVGQRLLRFPHYIDTIHGFTGRFLASPWLRSKDIALQAIDDEATHKARRRELTYREHLGAQAAFEKKFKSLHNLRVRSADFDDPLGDEDIGFAQHTATYKSVVKSLSGAAKAGYFCFDEVFVLGHALLDQEPAVGGALRLRFPCVLIDEMQDTQPDQADILQRVFPHDDPDVRVIRVGDPNQEIFERKTPLQDPFPDPGRQLEIASSFRFDQSIASIANPFAYVPITNGLIGLRVPRELGSVPNTIIVFPDNDATGVLDEFGKLVLEHLPAEFRKAGVFAIGAVHRLENFKANQYPKALEHYWPSYRSDTTKTSFKPRTFAEGACVAKRTAMREATAASAVELLALCLINLGTLAFPGSLMQLKGRHHAAVEEKLTAKPQALAQYRECLQLILFGPPEMTEQDWLTAIAPRVLLVATALHDAEGVTVDLQGHQYLAWESAPVATEASGSGGALVNTYRFQNGADGVDIQMSSIHSEKGKTHAATLILETFRKTHFIQKLMPWLECQKASTKRPPDSAKKDMMLMYVGMTRPSQMLCLAVRKSSMGEGTTGEKRRAALEASGWSILELAT